MKAAQARAPYSSRQSPNQRAPLPLGSMRENGGPWHSSDSVRWLVGIPTLHPRSPNRNTFSQTRVRRELRRVSHLFLTLSLKLPWPLGTPLSDAAHYTHLAPSASSCQPVPHRRERSSGLCRSPARSIRFLS